MLSTYNQITNELNKRLKYALRFQTEQGKYFYANEISFVVPEKDYLICYLEDGDKSVIKGDLKELEKNLQESNHNFIRSHRSYLVNLERIRSVAKGKRKNEFKLFFDNHKKHAIVTSANYKKVVKALNKILIGIKTLEHISPDSEYAKKIRSLGLLSIGIEELGVLDLEEYANGDSEAVEEVENFKKTYDMRFLPENMVYELFKEKTTNKLDKRKVIVNCIWQVYQWIKRGLFEPLYANIKKLWYRHLEIVLNNYGILEQGDLDIYGDAISDMYEMGLFKYRDFEFTDNRENFRGIGKNNPQIILLTEKEGQAYIINDLANKWDTSFLILSGQPTLIFIEYFVEQLKKVIDIENDEIHLFTAVDLNYSGQTIAENTKKNLEFQGVKKVNLKQIVTLDLFKYYQVETFRKPIAVYEEIEEELNETGEVKKDIIPVYPSSGHVTQAINWFEKYINDDRMRTREKIKNGYRYTIYGIQSDTLDDDTIMEAFKSEISPLNRDFPELLKFSTDIMRLENQLLTMFRELSFEEQREVIEYIKMLKSKKMSEL